MEMASLALSAAAWLDFDGASAGDSSGEAPVGAGGEAVGEGGASTEAISMSFDIQFMNHIIHKTFNSRCFDEYLDLGAAKLSSSVSAFFSKHADSAARIAEGIIDYDLPHFSFLRFNMAQKERLQRSYNNNVVLQSTILKLEEDRVPRARYNSQFISPLFQEFPDGGLFKSAVYACMTLRHLHPDSAYAAQIGQSYLEYAFFAYGVYFETGGKLLSLRAFEDLLDAFDKKGVEFTDALKLYKLQTFIEKAAEGQNPFYDSERAKFEAETDYSEDDFRAIPSERIFPMVEFDPEDWKASQLPLQYNKSEAQRFRLVAREFLASREELDPVVGERELFRFQNVSCAKEDNPGQGSKLRKEVRSGYEMTNEPFQFKRTLINVSTSNYRDSWVNTPGGRAKLKYFEILCRRMIRNVPEIPDGDMENDGFVENLRFSPDHTYVMGDLKKWGITFPVYLIRIFCEEAEARFPLGWTTLASQFENASLWVNGERHNVGVRGFGLGNLNYMSSIIHYLILKMTNADKFVVRSDDSLTCFKKADNPHYEIYLKEQLGFIVNKKKINISSKANVFCENYAEVEAKFQSQGYEKFGYMAAQIGTVMRKVCNSLSAKYFISTACEINIPAKTLIDFLISINYYLFGPEFAPGETKLDHHCGGWSRKYYSTNLKTEYIALENDLIDVPEYEALAKALYANKLSATAPSRRGKPAEEYYPLLRDKLFPTAQVVKEQIEKVQNVLVPITTPFEYVQMVNDQLSQLERANMNSHLRQRRWKQLQKKRQRIFSEINVSAYYDVQPEEILLPRIEENFLNGKGGYAIPFSIFEDEEYIHRSVHCLGSGISTESVNVRGPRKSRTLEEEDRQMADFLTCIQHGYLPVDIPRFDLWVDHRKSLYSMNEYGNSILATEGYQEVIANNEKYLCYFNIPTEIAYFDWCTRLSLKGDPDVFRTNFRFKVPSKRSLYQPSLFKRYSAFPGPDPRRITYYGVHFYVNPDEFEIIKSGLKLMKYLPEYEQELSDLFNLLYKEGIIAPSFKIRRDELHSQVKILQNEQTQSEGIEPSEDQVLLDLLSWRSKVGEETYELSLEEALQDSELADYYGLTEAEPGGEQDQDFEIERLENLFSAEELVEDLEESSSEEDEDFDFSYDYESNDE
jgi:hypothetical protein